MISQSIVRQPVAIVGIACEFAGDIHSPTDLWETLKHSRDVGSGIPADRTDLVSYAAHMLNQDNDGRLRKQLIRGGYFLSASQWDTFDPSFFGLSDAEAVSIDPCHRLLMLKFVHLLDDAGYTLEKMRGSRTSVHIGQFSTDHAANTLRMKPEYRSRLHGPNGMLYNASARLSYHFNLHGPNLSLDVACSSSLEAVHLGVQTLLTGGADMAVCGGVNIVQTPENLLYGSIIGAQSPDGRSRSFSINANGYAKGEGLGLVLLKRLSDAERDGDRIYCVLRDVFTNHDGSEGKNNFVVPSPVGQTRLLADIYKRAKFDTQRIFYVEAHGTGTPVGDPIEANSLGRFFNRSPLDPPLLIGSVKSNLGHTEGTAGVAALIKVALSMHYRAVPPNMHFTALNPRIEAQRYNLHIVQHIVPFPPPDNDNPVAIGINSFSMGGNNAHAIVEEYRPRPATMLNQFSNGHTPDKQGVHKQHFIFIISTKSRESLLKQVTQFNAWLKKSSILCEDYDDTFLARVSQQLLLKRTISHEHLAIFVSVDRAQLQQQLDAFLIEQAALGLLIVKRPAIPIIKLCFVFSGQGPQWWAMGRQLYESEPVFSQWIQRIDAELTKVNNGEWRLLDELIGKSNESDSHINDTNIAQPALFAIQVAIAALLVSWHVFPSVIVSHSAGEQAAAFVAGRVTLQEAVRIVYHRSRLQHRNTRQGGRMLAVSMSEQEARNLLLKDIDHLACVAVVNSPRSVTLSGNEETIDEIQKLLSTFYPNVFKARLRIENAFHSHQMDRFGVREEMFAALHDISGLPLRDPQQMFDKRCAQARLYSSVIGSQMDDHTPFDANYWWSNVRQCVRFGDAIAAIVQDEAANAFLELSPHPVLATSIRECCESTALQPLILPTLKRKEDEQTTLLASLAQLTWSPVVWRQYFKSRNVLPIEDDSGLFETFPLYAFHTSSCWYESKESVFERLANRIPTHPLLGVRQWTQQTSATWKSLINLNLREYAYLKDHKIQDAILFPATGFLELALAACRQLLPLAGDKQPLIIFEQIEFVKALVLTDHELIEVFTQVAMPMHEWFVYSRSWTSAGQECMRLSGMSGTDVIDSFVDPQTLNQYSLREFTLHARGRIVIGNAQQEQQQLSLLANDIIPRESWSQRDSINAYAHLSARGYQYGPRFQLMQSLGGTITTVRSQISSSMSAGEDDSCYHLLNPAVLDACMHSILTLLPGTGTTFIPVAIRKMTIFEDAKTIDHSTVQMRAAYHSDICGIAKERSYTLDLVVGSGDTKTMKTLVSFESVTIQQVQGAQSGRWALDKSVFDKLNSSVDMPNRELTVHLDTITTEYCLKTMWTDAPIVTSATHLLPSPEQFLKIEIDFAIDEDLIESIEPLNQLAACYAQMALTDLELNHEDQQQPLLSACRSLVCHLQDKVTFHSTHIRLMHVFDRFPRLKPLFIVLTACGSRLKQVLTGKQGGIEVLSGNKEMNQGLQQIQTLISASKMRLVFDAVNRHLRQKYDQGGNNLLTGRKLRVIWLGGGNSSDALPVIQLWLDLCRETGLLIDLHYVESDSILLAEAKHTFCVHLVGQNQLCVTYDNAFDLSNTEISKNMVLESYDIVFAANKLQGIQDLTYSLVVIRRLLVPNGLLLLLEMTRVPSYFDLIFGLLDIWWSSSGDDRALLDVQQWITAIQQAGGFAAVQAVPSEFANSLIVAQKTISCEMLQTLNERQNQAWLLFFDDHIQNIGHALASLLPCANVKFVHPSNSSSEDIRFILKHMIAKYEQLHIVFAWPLDQTSLNDDSEKAFVQQEKLMCGTIVNILQTIQAAQPHFHPFVFVLTRNVQPGSGNDLNPIGAPLIGLARSLAIEYEPHRLKLIDLQTSSSAAADEPSVVRALAQHLVMSRCANDLDEIVLRQDQPGGSVKRIEWHYEMLQKQQEKQNESLLEQISIIPQRDADQQPFRLCVAPSRFLADLAWVRDKAMGELSPGTVGVRIHCIGLNFRDVLKARGLYPHTRVFAQSDKHQPRVDRDTEPGLDFVGTVVRSFSNVNFQPGDRVLGVSVRGVFHSHVVIDAREIVLIPDECDLTDEQLAAMPTVCLTVLYSLKHRVNLRRGQTVLVHAATGGAGQACIQYCHSIGARVLATAGSDEKRRFLREHCGVEHVFNSRDLSFVNGVRALLPDGVDVIVNSLTGSLLQESIKLLSTQGHFVEWGKRDVYDKTPLSMFDFRNDCSFHVICVGLLGHKQLDIFGELVKETMQTIAQGIFKPIKPTVIYEPSQVIEAFTRFNSGQTMGKCVIRLTSSKQPLLLNNIQYGYSNQEKDSMFPSEVCDQGTILISGGFGGLGLTMSRWMVEERAVKRLVLMSRRTLIQLEQPDNPQYEEWLRLKRAANEHDAHVDVVQADVTKFEHVHVLIERLGQTLYPVRGIIHSAVIEEDRSLAKLTQETLTRVLGPKVRGAWNLHQASQLAHAPLHFFVLFSSIRNHLIDFAAGAYNAGNQFLDTLARYRSEQLHLPALSVSLPAVSGAGMFHRHRDMLASLQSTQGFELVPTVAVFELIERFHVGQMRCPCPIIFASNWRRLYEIVHKLPTYQLGKLVEQQHDDTDHLSTSAISSGIAGAGSIYNNLETIIERTQATVARLLGATNIDRIFVDRSLVGQGIDSLAAVSLYNWLGQETSVFVPLADLLQGISIQSIAMYVHGKLKEQQQASLSSNTDKQELLADPIRENEIEVSNSSYTGIENVLCLRQPVQSNSSVLFCIADNSAADITNSFSLFAEKLSGQHDRMSPSAVYVLQVSPETSSIVATATRARNMILQMRRIQPRGPYMLVAAPGEQGEIIAREMIEQFKEYSAAPIVQLLLLGEHNGKINNQQLLDKLTAIK